MKQLITLKSFQIFRTEIKKSKTYSNGCPFYGISNVTTLMQIQSGPTVPLKGNDHGHFCVKTGRNFMYVQCKAKKCTDVCGKVHKHTYDVMCIIFVLPIIFYAKYSTAIF